MTRDHSDGSHFSVEIPSYKICPSLCQADRSQPAHPTRTQIPEIYAQIHTHHRHTLDYDRYSHNNIYTTHTCTCTDMQTHAQHRHRKHIQHKHTYTKHPHKLIATHTETRRYKHTHTNIQYTQHTLYIHTESHTYHL